ncbi:hypothetical protein DFJ73DRAFT_617030, partial [Zopfochytrium polystomum]
FDAGNDCPIELLHCVNLGLVKYAMRATIASLSIAKREQLKAIINGLDSSTFPKPFSGHQLVHHVKSLNGKDIHAFCQIAPFALQDVADPEVVEMWIEISSFSASVYAGSTEDIEEYINDLDCQLDRMICAIFGCKFCWDIVKPKLHMLRECPFYVRRFGPLKCSGAETPESHNKVIRSEIISTNRKNTSRDVARNFATKLAAQHLLTSG